MGDSEGVFYLVNRTTGATNFSPTLEVGEPIDVGNDNGKVLRIHRSTGAIERTYCLGDGRKIRSLGIADDGTNNPLVSVITNDGYVFLFQPPSSHALQETPGWIPISPTSRSALGNAMIRRPTVTSKRVEKTVLAIWCKKTPSTPGPTCSLAKKFYG